MSLKKATKIMNRLNHNYTGKLVIKCILLGLKRPESLNLIHTISSSFSPTGASKKEKEYDDSKTKIPKGYPSRWHFN